MGPFLICPILFLNPLAPGNMASASLTDLSSSTAHVEGQPRLECELVSREGTAPHSVLPSPHANIPNIKEQSPGLRHTAKVTIN